MRALVLEKYGKSNQLRFATVSRPTIKPDEMLVQVHAVGLNPIDNLIPKGAFKPILKFQLPAVMGSDLAGVVVEVGNQVTRFKPGDAVYASLFDLGSGSLAEYAAVPEFAAAVKPARLDYVQAASIPMVGLTAWQALNEGAGIKPGQNVFIPAGSGGVGSFAMQLAKYIGANVATTTSAKNVELLKQLGADVVIDYKTHDFEKLLHEYDAALATVKGDAIEKLLNILKPNSRLVSLIGPPELAFANKRQMNVILKLIFRLISAKIIRLSKKQNTEYSFLFVQPNGQQLTEIARIIDEGHINAVVDKVFPFDQALEALSYLSSGRAKGKVVVRLI